MSIKPLTPAYLNLTTNNIKIAKEAYNKHSRLYLTINKEVWVECKEELTALMDYDADRSQKIRFIFDESYVPEQDATKLHDSKPLITVSVTSWKDPDKTNQVIAALRRQSIPLIIWVWNNGEFDKFPQADAVTTSGVNTGSFAGIAALSPAVTDYILKIDDDVVLTDEMFLEKALPLLDIHKKSVVCVMGRILPGAKPYYSSKAGSGISHVAKDTFVDMCIGQCMLMRTEMLEYIPLRTLNKGSEEDLTTSFCVPGPHIVPAVWTNGWRTLEKGESYSGHREHWLRRGTFVERYLKFFKKAPPR